MSEALTRQELDELYRTMAALLAAIFRPEKHVDVGCGKGFLTGAMPVPFKPA